MSYEFPAWWPNPPMNLEREGSNEFDAAWASFLNEEPQKRVRFGLYYESDDYDWFEVTRG
jgi:hypothetical protein